MKFQSVTLVSAFAFAILSSNSVFAQALPSSRPVSAEAVALAQVFFEQADAIKKALAEAGIDQHAKVGDGSVARMGMPGDYSDVYTFGMYKCGPTPTSPCFKAGQLTVNASHKSGPMGGEKVTYAVSAQR